MELQTLKDKSLDDYYNSPEGKSGGIEKGIKAEKMGISPYEIEETIYYFGKHLALPGIVGIFIPLTIIFGIFENSFIETLSYIIYALAAILLLSVGRELVRGWRYKIKEGALYLPGPYIIKREAENYDPCINEITETKYTIGFVGDIMKMNKFDLEFHPDIKSFFKDTDLIIGNLEGIITNQPCPRLKQAHTEDILPQLESLLSENNKWLLCVSNNHSEDFSSTQFNESLHKIQGNSNFDVFGRQDISFLRNQNKDITITCATQWSNQKTWNYTFRYNNPTIANLDNSDDNNDKYPFRLIKNTKFNILLPHWGFENEKYVRTRFQKDAKALLTGITPNYRGFQKIYKKRLLRGIFAHPDHKWDLIFAHHPHVLQPIMKVQDEIKLENKKSLQYNKVAVFSAGNFTSGANISRKKKHISGIIMKCQIGPLKGYEEKLAIGKMEWRRTKNFKTRVGKKPAKLVCIDNEKYRTYNKPFLINGMILFIIFLLFYLINLYS